MRVPVAIDALVEPQPFVLPVAVALGALHGLVSTRQRVRGRAVIEGEASLLERRSCGVAPHAGGVEGAIVNVLVARRAVGGERQVGTGLVALRTVGRELRVQTVERKAGLLKMVKAGHDQRADVGVSTGMLHVAGHAVI